MFNALSNLWETAKDNVLDRFLPVQNGYLGLGYARRKNASAKLVGYKRAGLWADSDDNVLLMSMHGRGTTALDADATCSYNSYGFGTFSTHVVPDWSCECGFYAYDDIRDAVDHSSDPSTVLLKVVISGKYVKYQFGWRYAHQRVTEVIVGRCAWGYGCSNPATSFVKDGKYKGELKPACVDHALMESVKNRFTFEQTSHMLTASSSKGYKPILVRNLDETVKPATSQQLSARRPLVKAIKAKLEDSGLDEILFPAGILAGGAGVFIAFLNLHDVLGQLFMPLK